MVELRKDKDSSIRRCNGSQGSSSVNWGRIYPSHYEGTARFKSDAYIQKSDTQMPMPLNIYQ